MIDPRMTQRALALALIVVTAGCSTPPTPAPRQAGLSLPLPELEVREEVTFHRAWADVPIDSRGDPDAVELARWVTERRNAADRALKDEPMRLMQAVEILAQVARRVPDSSFARQRLAQSYFMGAAIWFKNADATAWSMDNLLATDNLPDGTQVADEDHKQAMLTEFQTYLETANKQTQVWAQRALTQFMAYRALRPDDKAVLDSVWKIFFYLQNYDEALKWLDAVLRELEIAEVSESDPLYRDYSLIRAEMVDYIAQVRIDSSGALPET